MQRFRLSFLKLRDGFFPRGVTAQINLILHQVCRCVIDNTETMNGNHKRYISYVHTLTPTFVFNSTVMKAGWICPTVKGFFQYHPGEVDNK